jgi:hypothetical protein
MNQDTKNRVVQLERDMANAKEAPAEHCIEGKQHDYMSFSHSDSKESYT